jgi:formylglycine-generating enzyme required for sulfatase activity
MLLNNYAWSAHNSGLVTHPVGQLKPNRLGLFDMYGNVWEWVQDARLWARPVPVTAVAEDREEPSGILGEFDRNRIGSSCQDNIYGGMSPFGQDSDVSGGGIPGNSPMTGFRIVRTWRPEG